MGPPAARLSQQAVSWHAAQIQACASDASCAERPGCSLDAPTQARLRRQAVRAQLGRLAGLRAPEVQAGLQLGQRLRSLEAGRHQGHAATGRLGPVTWECWNCRPGCSSGSSCANLRLAATRASASPHCRASQLRLLLPIWMRAMSGLPWSSPCRPAQRAICSHSQLCHLQSIRQAPDVLGSIACVDCGLPCSGSSGSRALTLAPTSQGLMQPRC